MKMRKTEKGTLEKELSDLNISNRIYNQTFISFIFRINIKIIQTRENKKRVSDLKMKNSCLHMLQLVVKVTGTSKRTFLNKTRINQAQFHQSQVRLKVGGLTNG